MIKMLRQKAITAFFCEKYDDHVQHNQCTSSESVNLAASAKPVDLDEDYSTRTIQSLLRVPEEIKGVLLASFLIPSKLHLLDETVVAKIEQSLGDELPNNSEFGQEEHVFQLVLPWKMKNNNSDAKKI
ncbi:uncharacterized protein LOC141889642 [Acropora palmata]|uniref:uncharacterized protein LOC141889642 n=1 Tax=Acropora palmata TaxID=6131 RepID=UPI003DA060EC